MGQTRRRDLFKSDGEVRAETLRRVLQRQRASFAEAAIILELTQPTIRSYCDKPNEPNGIQTIRIGARRYILPEELERWKEKSQS